MIMNKKKVALIGYGALGRIFSIALTEKLSETYIISGVLEQNPECFEAINNNGFGLYRDIDELILDKPDYVVEMAGGGAIRALAKKVLSSGIKLVVASIGALADDELRKDLIRTASEHDTKFYLISGAIGGFDVLQTIKLMGESKGIIENFKAPVSLNGAPYLNGELLSEEKVTDVFSGNAREAIAGFPNNVNVAISSALASVGIDEMKVNIQSVPGLEDNIHKVTVSNPLVKAVIEISSSPDKNNPKSSTMTAWSAVALLKNLASPMELF